MTQLCENASKFLAVRLLLVSVASCILRLVGTNPLPQPICFVDKAEWKRKVADQEWLMEMGQGEMGKGQKGPGNGFRPVHTAMEGRDAAASLPPRPGANVFAFAVALVHCVVLRNLRNNGWYSL